MKNKKKNPIITVVIVLVIYVMFKCNPTSTSAGNSDNSHSIEIAPSQTETFAMTTFEDALNHYSEGHLLSVQNDYNYDDQEDACSAEVLPIESAVDDYQISGASAEYYQESASVDPYEAIEDAINRRESSICIVNDVYDLKWADVSAMGDYGCFWVSEITSSHYSEDGNDYNTYYFSYYNISENDIAVMKAQIDNQISNILSGIPAGQSQPDICKTVHDYLIGSISYDQSLTADYNENAFGGLVLGRCTCAGYAATYHCVLSRLGIPCAIVQNDTHAFCKVGQTYVDVCFDDIGAVDENGNAVISYYYFGMSYDQVISEPAHEVSYITHGYNNNDYIIPYYYENYELSYYDYNAVLNIYRDQLSRGNLFPIVLFTNYQAYEDCAEHMQSDIWAMLDELGYTGDYCVFYPNEERLTWGIGLSPTYDA